MMMVCPSPSDPKGGAQHQRWDLVGRAARLIDEAPAFAGAHFQD